ncbi:MAG: asparagine--tRNA ligase [Oligoflexia bacterium]|nr:asparagine--tRNA ligase [Oligoflexia bacterium]
MKRQANIKNLAEFEGRELELKAWVSQFRSSGKIAFLVLRDGSGECQAVLSEKTTDGESFKLFSKVSLECLVQVQARVKKWKQGFELEVLSLKILSPSPDYPIAKKAHGVDFLLTHRHLWLRSKRQRSLLKIRSEVMRHIHDFFQKEDFVQVSAPILMPTASEGTSSLFSVDFFKEDQVFLSQSGQLHMESASSALSKVYCFGPAFRAEKSSTRRHLLEFWMVEPEMAFYSLKEAMELAEQLVEYVIQNTIQNNSSDFGVLKRDIKKLEKIKSPFPKISYQEACKILKEKQPDFVSGKDFGAVDESLLSASFDQPVFVQKYPKNIKAFYMKEDPQNSDLSLSFDLLATEGYGELIGGSEREDNLDILLKKIREHGLEERYFKWYLDLRRYGSFPHSGFGLGLERLISWLCGLEHVREAIPFPRLYGRSFFEKQAEE